MNVKDCSATVKLDRNELWLLATTLEYRIMDSIKDHYNCLQQSKDGEALFFEQEKERLALMQEFYGLQGSSLCYESFIRRAKAAFQAKREERKKEAKK